MGMSLFFKLFAGVPMDEMDVFPLVPLGRWLFTIGIYLLVIAFRLGRSKQNRQFVMIRYGWIRKWWRYHFLKNLLYGVFSAMILMGLFQIINLRIPQNITISLKETVMITLLWTAHGMTLSALFLFMETINMEKSIPAAILLLEGLTFLSGYRYKWIARFMFGAWGMYVQSNLYENVYGFSVISVIAVQAVIIAECYLLGRCVCGNKGVEGA